MALPWQVDMRMKLDYHDNKYGGKKYFDLRKAIEEFNIWSEENYDTILSFFPFNKVVNLLSSGNGDYGNFEANITGWTAVNATLSQSSTEAQQGTNSLKAVVDSNGAAQVLSGTLGAPVSQRRQVIQAWVFVVTSQEEFSISLETENAGINQIAEKTKNTIISENTTGQWIMIERVVAFDDDDVYKIRIDIEGLLLGDIVYIDNVKTYNSHLYSGETFTNSNLDIHFEPIPYTGNKIDFSDILKMEFGNRFLKMFEKLNIDLNVI